MFLNFIWGGIEKNCQNVELPLHYLPRHSVQFIHRIALVLVNDLCVNLRCLYIRVSRKLTDRFNRRFEAQEECSVHVSRYVERYFFVYSCGFYPSLNLNEKRFSDKIMTLCVSQCNLMERFHYFAHIQ